MVAFTALGVLTLISFVSAIDSTGDDLVRFVLTGDTDSLLQQIGHGSLPDAPDSKGRLALVQAGVTYLLSHGAC